MSTAILPPLDFDRNRAPVRSVVGDQAAVDSQIHVCQEVKESTPDITQRKFQRCCWLIGMTSALDAFLAVYFKETILYLEQNPICLQLIEWEPTFMSLFLAGKFTGTAMAIAVMVGLFRFRRHMGFAVAMAISVFQVGLIAYQMIS